MLLFSSAFACIVALAAFGNSVVLRGSGDDSYVSGSGICEHLSAWLREREYSNGDKVIYWGYIWTAAEWSYNSRPSEIASEWIKSEVCGDDNQNSRNHTRSTDKRSDWDDDNRWNDDGVDKHDGGNGDADGDDDHNKLDGWGEGDGDGGDDACDCSDAVTWTENIEYEADSFCMYNGHLWYTEVRVEIDISVATYPEDSSSPWLDKGECAKQ